MMVDPISLAVVSGASMVSMIVGRFSKNSSPIQETGHQLYSDGKLQFVTLKQIVDPQQFVELINQGNSIFLNIRALYSQADKLSEFLYNLEIIAKRHDLALKQISSDLILFTDKNQLKRLSPTTIAVNRDPSSHNIRDKPIEVQAS
ncbi:MAG: hypothetical protein HeimC2_43190 [Candidatus Heimdallarchaeota archaeon LC_2]|nr:MAG: hypothetical protein HeimC2_43190 [Candidatus Heimdallarchaeota archaeon LC_2]